MLKVSGTVDFGIDAGDATLEGLNLGVDTHLRSRQTWDAHLHLHEADASLMFHILNHLTHLADACLAGIAYFVACGDTVYHLFLNRYLGHNYIIVYTF